MKGPKTNDRRFPLPRRTGHADFLHPALAKVVSARKLHARCRTLLVEICIIDWRACAILTHADDLFEDAKQLGACDDRHLQCALAGATVSRDVVRQSERVAVGNRTGRNAYGSTSGAGVQVGPAISARSQVPHECGFTGTAM